MPNYFYTAKSADGQTITGTLTARDEHELSQILKNDSMVLIRAVLDVKKNKKSFLDFSSKISVTEKIMMTRNLSVMVASGLSLVSSFSILIAQSRNKKLKEALVSVKERINNGESLSLAMSSYPQVFSDFFVSMVKVGEESGTLEEVLKVLSLQIEKEHKLKSQVQGAMIYPSIVLALMLCVLVVVVVVVLPRLEQFFTNINANIPFYTKAMINAGKFSSANWPIIIIVIAIFIFLISLALKTKTGKRVKDTIFLRIPLISSLVQKSNCAILIRSLSSLLGSGVPLVRSLEVARETVGNYYFQQAVGDSLEKIKKGEKLSESLFPYKNIFPYGAIEMLEVGEETGKTTSVLKTLADFYEEELMSATTKLSAAIEPILIIILGLGVAFFAFSVIEPMYSSLQFIH